MWVWRWTRAAPWGLRSKGGLRRHALSRAIGMQTWRSRGREAIVKDRHHARSHVERKAAPGVAQCRFEGKRWTVTDGALRIGLRSAGEARSGGTIRPMRITAAQQQRIDALCRRYCVRQLRMFGAAATGDERPDSDVDLLVEFVPGQAPSAFAVVDLQDELSAVFDGRAVDLAFEVIRK